VIVTLVSMCQRSQRVSTGGVCSTYLSERYVQAVRGERKRAGTEGHLVCGVVKRVQE
jgi:hypothetical protein